MVLPVSGQPFSLPTMSAPYHSSWQWSSNNFQHASSLPPSAEPLYPPQQNYAVEPSNRSSYDPSFRPPETTPPQRQTPSPTPSEQKELAKGAINWSAMMNWRFWIRREWLCMFRSYLVLRIIDNVDTGYYVALVVILVLTALMTLYHKQIVDWLTPVTRWLHE